MHVCTLHAARWTHTRGRGVSDCRLCLWGCVLFGCWVVRRRLLWLISRTAVAADMYSRDQQQ